MKSLQYLNKYFIKYKWQLLLGTFFVIASNFFYIKMPVFLKDVIDSIIAGDGNVEVIGVNVEIDPNDVLGMALYIGLIYMSLILLKSIFLFFMRQTIIKVSRYIEFDLKNEIYAQYQKLGYNFYKQNSTGDLMNRISEDVSHVRMYLGPGIMYNLNLLAAFTMIVYQMVAINGILTVIVLIPLPIMSFLIYKVSNRMSKLSLESQKEQSNLSTIVQETFAGIRVVKAYGREQEVNERFESSSMKYRGKLMKLVLINSLFQPTIMCLIGLSTILSIYVGGLLTYTGEVSLGGITAFVFFVNSLTWPFASLGWLTSVIQRAGASQSRINEFLKQTPEVVNPTSEPFSYSGKIEFRNVTYTYEGAVVPAISNLSFTVEPNETVAFFGRTASGKSTVLKLLMRQIEPQQGEILIDGKPLNSINIDEFRNQVGIVPQEVFLFSDTINNNIRFGTNEPVSDEDVRLATEYAHVRHNIESFEFGFDTVLGERGVNLSGGQKQRVSIARALIRKPKLLLMDDCLSAVDTETEEIILSHLKNDVRAINSIIVSHRISSIRNAQKIIVLDAGVKIEEGSHEQLIDLQGAYNEIYTQQLTEENI